MEQTGKDDLLQCAPASCYSSAPSSAELYLVTPGLLPLPSEMSYTSMKSIPGIQEALWHRGKCNCCSCPSAGQRTGPAKPHHWNKAGIAVPRGKLLAPDTASMGRTLSACFPAAENILGLNLTQKFESSLWILQNHTTSVKRTRWDVKTHLTSEHKVFAYFEEST